MSNTPKLRFPEFKGEWEEKKLGDVCDIVGGGTPDTTKDEYWNGNIQWFTPTEIGSSKYISESKRKITQLGYEKSSAKLLPAGTILFTSRATLGEMSITTVECTTNQGFQSLIPNKFVNPDYLYYLQPILQKYCYSKSSGSTFLEISAKTLRECRLPYPTLPEQQKIADFLSNVDSIITAETKILNTLQKKKKALMQKLFTQQLRFKSVNGTDFPAWEEKKLRDVCSYIGGGTPSKKVKEYWNGNINWASVKDITGKYLYETQDKISQLGVDSSATNICGPDSLLLITRMSPGKTVITKCITAINQDLKIVKSDINVEFLHLIFQSIQTKIDEKTSGTTVKGISIEGLNQIDIRLPCKEEQQKIADCLSSMDSLIQTQQKVVTTWQQRKKALLQQMFI